MPRLTENEVVGPEDVSEGAGPHGVHGARLQVHENGTRNVLITCGRSGTERAFVRRQRRAFL